MQTHALKGREIIDDLLKNFELENIEYICRFAPQLGIKSVLYLAV